MKQNFICFSQCSSFALTTAFSLGVQCLSGWRRSPKTLHEGCHSGEGREPRRSDPRGTGGVREGQTLQKDVTEDRWDFVVLPLIPYWTLYLVNWRELSLVLGWGSVTL